LKSPSYLSQALLNTLLDFGVAFPSYAQSGISTPTATTLTTIATSTLQTVMVTDTVSNLPALTSVIPTYSIGSTASSSTANTAAAYTNVASTPASRSSKSTLSTGSIVGIAMGGIALILIAILVGVLLWRRRGNPQATPPSAVPDTDSGSHSRVVLGGSPHFEKDSTIITARDMKPDNTQTFGEERVVSEPANFVQESLRGGGPPELPASYRPAEADSAVVSYNNISISRLLDHRETAELHSTPLLSRSILSAPSQQYIQPSELESQSPVSAPTPGSSTLVSLRSL
jgi:hypothetical protein